jgi:hypothetical protein
MWHEYSVKRCFPQFLLPSMCRRGIAPSSPDRSAFSSWIGFAYLCSFLLNDNVTHHRRASCVFWVWPISCFELCDVCINGALITIRFTTMDPCSFAVLANFWDSPSPSSSEDLYLAFGNTPLLLEPHERFRVPYGIFLKPTEWLLDMLLGNKSLNLQLIS